MARVDFRAPRKTALPIFKKHHRPHQKNVHNAVKRRNQASVFDHLALTSFHTFSLSLRRGSKPEPHVLEQERLSARKQARRWLVDVIAGQHDAMFPSTPEKHAFFALSKLPTDQALYEALTEEKVSQKVKMLYARYFRQRDKVRREQGSTYYTVAVADWWVLPEANKKMTKADKRAKKAGKTTKKAETLAKQAEIRAKFKNWGKVVADQGVVKGYNEVSWEKLGGERPQEKGKGEHFFALNMPLRGPRI